MTPRPSPDPGHDLDPARRQVIGDAIAMSLLLAAAGLEAPGFAADVIKSLHHPGGANWQSGQIPVGVKLTHKVTDEFSHEELSAVANVATTLTGLNTNQGAVLLLTWMRAAKKYASNVPDMADYGKLCGPLNIPERDIVDGYTYGSFGITSVADAQDPLIALAGAANAYNEIVWPELKANVTSIDAVTQLTPKGANYLAAYQELIGEHVIRGPGLEPPSFGL